MHKPDGLVQEIIPTAMFTSFCTSATLTTLSLFTSQAELAGGGGGGGGVIGGGGGGGGVDVDVLQPLPITGTGSVSDVAAVPVGIGMLVQPPEDTFCQIRT